MKLAAVSNPPRRPPRYAPGLYRKARREPRIVVSISKLKCFAGKKRHFLSRNDKFSPLRTSSEGAFSCEFETNQAQELWITLPLTILRGCGCLVSPGATSSSWLSWSSWPNPYPGACKRAETHFLSLSVTLSRSTHPHKTLPPGGLFQDFNFVQGAIGGRLERHGATALVPIGERRRSPQGGLSMGFLKAFFGTFGRISTDLWHVWLGLC